MRFEMLFLQIFEVMEAAYPKGRRRTERKNVPKSAKRSRNQIYSDRFLSLNRKITGWQDGQDKKSSLRLCIAAIWFLLLKKRVRTVVRYIAF